MDNKKLQAFIDDAVKKKLAPEGIGAYYSDTSDEVELKSLYDSIISRDKTGEIKERYSDYKQFRSYLDSDNAPASNEQQGDIDFSQSDNAGLFNKFNASLDRTRKGVAPKQEYKPKVAESKSNTLSMVITPQELQSTSKYYSGLNEFEPTKIGRTDKPFYLETPDNKEQGTTDTAPQEVEDFSKLSVDDYNKRISEIDKKIREIDERNKGNYNLALSAAAGMRGMQRIQPKMNEADQRERNALVAQKEFMESARNLTDFDNNRSQRYGFVAGLFKTPTAKNWLTFGINDMIDRLTINDIAQRWANNQDVSNTEKNAVLMYKQLDDLKNQERGLWYDVGQGTRLSLLFMAELAATGGAGGLAKAGGRAALERGISYALKRGMKSLGKQALNQAIKTPLMPTFYNTYLSNRLEGTEVKGDKLKFNSSVGKDLYYAAVDDWSGRFSESFGNVVSNVRLFKPLLANKQTNKFLMKTAQLLDKARGSNTYNIINNATRYVGVNSVPMEVAEEVFDNVTQSLLKFDAEPLKELTTAKWWETTALTTLMLGGLGTSLRYGAGAAEILSDKKKIEQNLQGNINRLAAIDANDNGKNKVRDNLVDAINNGSLVGADGSIESSDIYKAYKRYRATFANDKQALDAADALIKSVCVARGSDMGLNAIMQDAIGGEFTYYPSDNNDVMIAYNQDGSVRGYVIDGSKETGWVIYNPNTNQNEVVSDTEFSGTRTTTMPTSDFIAQSIVNTMPLPQGFNVGDLVVTQYGQGIVNSVNYDGSYEVITTGGEHYNLNDDEITLWQDNEPATPATPTATPTTTPPAAPQTTPIEIGSLVNYNGEEYEVSGIQMDNNGNRILTLQGAEGEPINVAESEVINQQTPAQPQEPTQPQTPATPQEPQTPAEPATQQTPAEPATPQEQAEPTGQVNYDELLDTNPIAFVEQFMPIMGADITLAMLNGKREQLVSELAEHNKVLSNPTKATPNKLVEAKTRADAITKQLAEIDNAIAMLAPVNTTEQEPATPQEPTEPTQPQTPAEPTQSQEPTTPAEEETQTEESETKEEIPAEETPTEEEPKEETPKEETPKGETPKEEEPKEPKDSGKRIVSDERLEELKKKLRKKLSNLNVGIDPELIAIGAEIGVAYIERGTRTFVRYSKAMINDFGNAIKPYLKMIYNAARDIAAINDTALSESMDNYEKVAKLDVNNIVTEERELELTEDDIANSGYENQETIDNAILYADGYVTDETEQSYNTILDYVRNQSDNSAADSTDAGGTQLGSTSDEDTGRDGGRDGSEDEQEDTDTDEGDVSEDRPSGEDGEDSMATPAGEQGDTDVPTDTPDVPTSDSGDTAGSGSVSGAGDNVGERGGQKGSRGVSNEDADRRNQPVNVDTEEEQESVEGELEKDIKALLNDKQAIREKGLVAYVLHNSKVFNNIVKLMKHYIVNGLNTFERLYGKIYNFLNILLGDNITPEQIQDFIKECWNTDIKYRGEVRKMSEWAAILEQEELDKMAKLSIEEKVKLQKKAEKIDVKVGDRLNIRETLPFLLPKQQDDVLKAEVQFFDKSHNDELHAYGKGYMFTNGTGTGKTYTGLGIAKRFIKQGKGRILIVTAQESKIEDFIRDAKNLGINATMLANTNTKGKGVVVTQYANFYQNYKLLEDTFDLIIYDESHKIMENQQGDETSRLIMHNMMCNRDAQQVLLRQAQSTPLFVEGRELLARSQELRKLIAKASAEELTEKEQERIREFGGAEAMQEQLNLINQDIERVEREKDRYISNLLQDEKKLAEAEEIAKKTKVVFLSATPFNTALNLDYAEGYIFSYPDRPQRGTYETFEQRERRRGAFIMERFPSSHYRSRNGYVSRLRDVNITDPVSASEEEISYSDYLQNTLNTMSGRQLDSPYDYSREFPRLDHPIAQFVNRAISALNGKYRALQPHFDFLYDYNKFTAFMEIIKTEAVIPRIKEHLKFGRKVAIYHRRISINESIANPFTNSLRAASADPVISESLIQQFANEFAQLLSMEQNIDWSFPNDKIMRAFATEEEKEAYRKELRDWQAKGAKGKAPILKSAKVAQFNGTISQKEKNRARDMFNDDNSSCNVIICQVASAKEGIDLHDKTSKHQRVLMQLSLPQSPIEFIQVEGRIYRIGSKTDAIFEYPIVGIDRELAEFATRINGRSETEENLSLGTNSRGLRESIARAALSNRVIPVTTEMGKGGKVLDSRKEQHRTIYDEAITNFYNWNKGKTADGFNTTEIPDPLGFKMIEWLGLENGDRLLVPFGGRGTVVAYHNAKTKLTAYEADQELYAELLLRYGGYGREFINDDFHNIANFKKYDGAILKTDDVERDVDMIFRRLEISGRAIVVTKQPINIRHLSNRVSCEIKLPKCVFGEDAYVSFIEEQNNATKQSIDISSIPNMDSFFEELRVLDVPKRQINRLAKILKKVEPIKAKIMSNPILKKNRKDGKLEPAVWCDERGFGFTLLDKYGITIQNSSYSRIGIRFGFILNGNQYEINTYAQQCVYIQNLLDKTDEELLQGELNDIYSKRVKDKFGDLSPLRELYNAYMSAIMAATGKTALQLKNISEGRVDNVLTGTMNVEQFRDAFESFYEGNEELRLIADRVFPIIQQIEGLSFKVCDASNFRARNVVAHYTPVTNSIELNNTWINSTRMSNEQKAATLLHEMIHACTVYYFELSENGVAIPPHMYEAVDMVKKAFDSINTNSAMIAEIRSGTTNDSNVDYSMSGHLELIAELSNTTLRRKLSNFPAYVYLINGKKIITSNAISGMNEAMLEQSTYLRLMDKYLDEFLTHYDADLYKAYLDEVQSIVGSGNQSQIRFRSVEPGSEKYAKLRKELTTNGEYVTMYANAVKIGGNYYPAMNTKTERSESRGKATFSLGEPIVAGSIIESEANYANIKRDENGNPIVKTDKNGNEWYEFILRGADGSTTPVAFNPYIHLTEVPLNDQFKKAWDKPLVVLEMRVPISELNSNYKAKGAKNSVGVVEWKGGSVMQQMKQKRMVALTRYAMPIGEVSVDEVADKIMAFINNDENKDVKIPINTVTPELRDALAERGAIFAPSDYNAGEAGNKVLDKAYKDWQAKREEYKGKARLRATDSQMQLSDSNIGDKIEQVKSVAEALSEKYGVKVNVIESVDSITDSDGYLQRAKRGSKGWFDASTGEVFIVAPNADSVDDVKQTYLHEVVGHLGLAKLLGNQFKPVMDSIFRSMSLDEQIDYLRRFGDKTIAAEEYCAEMAENIDNANPTMIVKIKEIVLAGLRKIGINIPMSADSVMYLLWKSKRKLEKNATIKQQYDYIQTDNKLRFRMGVSNDYAMSGFDKFAQSIYDSLKPINMLTDIIKQRGGDLSNNPVTKELLRSSKSKNEFDKFTEGFFKPILSAMAEIQRAAGNAFKTQDEVIQFINHTLIALHAAERNKYVACSNIANYAYPYLSRAFINSVGGREAAKALVMQLAEKMYDNQMRGIVNQLGNGSVYDESLYTSEQCTEIDNIIVKMRDAKIGNDDIILSAMDNTNNNLSGYSDTEARDVLKESYEKVSKTQWQDLSAAIKRATDEIINIYFRHNILDAQAASRIKSMYKNYVPLREWEETDGTEYASFGKGGTATPAYIRRAEGRKSLAEEPIAEIGKMAMSAIMMGGKNDVMVSAFRLAENNISNEDLFEIPVVYEVTDDETGEIELWLERPPQALFDAGRVKTTRSKGNYNWHKTSKQQEAHAIKAVIKGVQHIAYYQGTIGVESVAALKGLNNANINNQLLQYASSFTRWINANRTSRNPVFLVKNMIRDMMFAFFTYSAKGHNPLRLAGNLPKAFADIWRESIGGNPSSDYVNFLNNGGRTGYLDIRKGDINEIKKDYKKMVNAMRKGKLTDSKAYKAFASVYNLLNNLSETTMRYATYLSETQRGETMENAALAAKEATVNFNRRGDWSPALGIWFEFYNAALQGSMNFINLAFNKDWKITARSWAMIAAIAGIDILLRMLDDDDKEEDNEEKLNDYIRYSNICIPLGKGESGKRQYLLIPKAQGVRAMSNLGNIVYDFMQGDKTIKESVVQYLNGLESDLMPISVEPVNTFNSDKTKQQLLKDIVPAAVRPLVEVMVNVDYKGDRIYRDDNAFGDITPEYKKTIGATNKYIVGTSKYLNNIFGTDELSGKWQIGKDGKATKFDVGEMLDINPSGVQHLINGYLAGVYALANKAVAFVQSDDKNLNYAPFVGDFLKSSYEESGFGLYNELKNNLRIGKMTINAINPLEDMDTYKRVRIYYDGLDRLVSPYVDIVERYNKAIENTTDEGQKAYLKQEREKALKTLKKQYDKLYEIISNINK